MIDCEAARAHVLDYQRGRLSGALLDDVRAHLATCTACARLATEEQALSDVLEQRAPQHAASVALKRRMASQLAASAEEGQGRPTGPTARKTNSPLALSAAPAPLPRARSLSRSRWLAPTLAAAAVLVIIGLPLGYHELVTQRQGGALMVTEAVNDHLRVLSSQHPLDIASGGIHQVKPWFAGRLDFAPVVAFEGDREVALEGGAVGYFMDRKAAVFVYKIRAHTVSLFVFRADGLPWSSTGKVTTRARGFAVMMWRSGELGYALVSDVDAGELATLSAKISPAS